MSKKKPNILILAHIVEDAAIQRRASMLSTGGAIVTIAGFHRIKETVNRIEGYSVIDLGQTHNARFFQRIISVIKGIFLIQRHKDIFSRADIVIARNLEMLVLANRGRTLAKHTPILVYEVLDIHRLLIGSGWVGRALRYLEGILTRNVSLVITSSPAFIENYFTKLSHVNAPTYLIENKVIGWLNNIPSRYEGPTSNTKPPWVIGWFGVIRCKKSLQILRNLVLQSKGNVKVIIRGRPALDQFDNFYKNTSETPDLKFLGLYENPADLPRIYEEVDFIWSIDQFEKGMNSAWLLPNRMYEGGAYAVLPIAEGSVETGKFLKQLETGLLINSLESEELSNFFANLTPDLYQQMKRQLLSIPENVWIATTQDCQDVVQKLSELASPLNEECA